MSPPIRAEQARPWNSLLELSGKAGSVSTVDENLHTKIHENETACFFLNLYIYQVESLLIFALHGCENDRHIPEWYRNIYCLSYRNSPFYYRLFYYWNLMGLKRCLAWVAMPAWILCNNQAAITGSDGRGSLSTPLEQYFTKYLRIYGRSYDYERPGVAPETCNICINN